MWSTFRLACNFSSIPPLPPRISPWFPCHPIALASSRARRATSSGSDPSIEGKNHGKSHRKTPFSSISHKKTMENIKVSHRFPQNRRIKWWGSLDFGIQCPLGDLHLVAIACCDPRRTCEEEWSTLMFFCDYQGSKNLDELLSTVLSVSGEEWDNMLFQMDPNWVNCQSAAAEFWLTMITTGMYQCHPVAFFASKCLFYAGNIGKPCSHLQSGQGLVATKIRRTWWGLTGDLGGPLFWTSSLPYGCRSYSSCTMFVLLSCVEKPCAHWFESLEYLRIFCGKRFRCACCADWFCANAISGARYNIYIHKLVIVGTFWKNCT